MKDSIDRFPSLVNREVNGSPHSECPILVIAGCVGRTAALAGANLSSVAFTDRTRMPEVPYGLFRRGDSKDIDMDQRALREHGLWK